MPFNSLCFEDMFGADVLMRGENYGAGELFSDYLISIRCNMLDAVNVEWLPSTRNFLAS